MTEADDTIRALIAMNPLQKPVIQSAIQALQLPVGSRGLDAGCGIGLEALLLADAVGPSGHVTGLDISPRLLHHAAAIVRYAGLSERISFREGDVTRLLFEDGAFDWAWSSSCVGYAAALIPALAELVRVVRPGGTVALFFWSSENLLPGYPRLEAHLRATAPGIAPFTEGDAPESHFLRALSWFRELGLEQPTARTFVGDAHAPLAKDVRDALAEFIGERWPGAETELNETDRAEYARLCSPDSPDFIVDHPDYYAFFTCSLFYGRVAG